MRWFRKLALESLSLSLLLTATQALAQQTASTPRDEDEAQTGSGEFFLGVPVGFLSNHLQETQGLASTGWGIDIGGGFQYSWFNVVLDFGFEHYKDSKTFTQTVEDSYGNVYEAESRLDLSYFSPSVGLKTPVWTVIDGTFATTAAVGLGYALPFDTTRKIDNCTDCKEEHVDVDGGVFVEPGIALLYSGTPVMPLGLSVSWQRYLGTSDFESKLFFRAVIMGVY